MSGSCRGPGPGTAPTIRAMSSVEEIRERRPPEATVVRWLAIFAVVVWLPVAARLNLQLVALAMFFYVFGAFGVAKGRQAGRVMATIAVGVIYLFVLPYCLVGFSDPAPGGTFYAVLAIVGAVASIFGLTQMYHSHTSLYIHLVTAARSAPPPG